MGEIILKAENVTKSFDQGDRKVEILHAVTLTLSAGEIVAIVGPSGAGNVRA
jgi:ABC-type lipoprotein export system ATPase subunit